MVCRTYEDLMISLVTLAATRAKSIWTYARCFDVSGSVHWAFIRHQAGKAGRFVFLVFKVLAVMKENHFGREY